MTENLELIHKQKPFNKMKCICYLVLFIMAFIVFIANILSFFNQAVYLDEFQLFLDNVNSFALEDIKFIYTNATCQSVFDDEYEPLFKYEWPGTVMGCDCSQSFNFSRSSQYNIESFFNDNQNFRIGKSCNSQMIAKGCKQITEEVERTFVSWTDGSFGKPFTLCAKRYKGINLRANESLCQKQKSTFCGGGDNIFCVPENTSCPITQIGFTGNPDQFETKNITRNIQQIGDDFYFYYFRNTSSLPIVQFRIDEGQIVCRNLSNNISPDRFDYPLSKIKRYQCASQPNIDQLYSIVHQIDEEQFYYANNGKYLEETLPYFSLNSSNNWTLFSKSFISWSCGAEKLEEIIQKGEILTGVNTLLQILLVITTVYFICIGILYNVVQCIISPHFVWPCKCQLLSIYNSSLLNCCQNVIYLIIHLVLLIVEGVIYNRISQTRKLFSYVTDNECVKDSASLYFFDSLMRTLDALISLYIVVGLIFTILLFLYSLWSLIEFCNTKRQADQIYPVGEEPSDQDAVKRIQDINQALEEIQKIDKELSTSREDN